MPDLLLTPAGRIRPRYAWFEAAERLRNITCTCERAGIWWKTFLHVPEAVPGRPRRRDNRPGPLPATPLSPAVVGPTFARWL
jgi:hypothetical protein